MDFKRLMNTKGISFWLLASAIGWLVLPIVISSKYQHLKLGRHIGWKMIFNALMKLKS